MTNPFNSTGISSSMYALAFEKNNAMMKNKQQINENK